MQKLITAIRTLIILGCLLAAQAFADQYGTKNMIKMTTSVGELEIELYPEEAPVTVKNFVEYVENGFYDGTISIG